MTKKKLLEKVSSKDETEIKETVELETKQETELEKKNKEVNELIERLQRLQAEFDNYKKYINKEKEEFVKYSNHQIILKLLDIVDSFELALRNKDKNEDFAKGVELIYSQLYSLLEKEGIKKIKAIGQRLDPNLHEVMLIENGNEDGLILEELQSGYLLNDKVLRYAKVKVSKNNLGGNEDE